MEGQSEIQIPLPKLVEKVGRPVTPADVDTFGRLKEIRDESHRIRTLVKAWKAQHAQDVKMRRQYATGLLIALGVQSVFVNVIFVLMGLGKLAFEPWTARTFIMAVFAEIAAMVFWIVKYLFRQTGSELLQLGAHRPKIKTKRRGHEHQEKDR